MSDPISAAFVAIIWQVTMCSDGSPIDANNICKTGEKETIALNIVGGIGCDIISHLDQCLSSVNYLAQVTRNDVVIATIPSDIIKPTELRFIAQTALDEVNILNAAQTLANTIRRPTR